MSESDKFDAMAKELLPCEFVTLNDQRECLPIDKEICVMCSRRPVVAAALREQGAEIERLSAKS